MKLVIYTYKYCKYFSLFETSVKQHIKIKHPEVNKNEKTI